MYAGVPMASPVSVSFSLTSGVDRPGNAKVGHSRVPAREHDVLGLDVAVNDPPGMGVAECLGDLASDLQRVLEWQLLLAHQAVVE